MCEFVPMSSSASEEPFCLAVTPPSSHSHVGSSPPVFELLLQKHHAVIVLRDNSNNYLIT